MTLRDANFCRRAFLFLNDDLVTILLKLDPRPTECPIK